VQDFAAGFAGHAFHKTVLTAALAFLGLISSFWHPKHFNIRGWNFQLWAGSFKLISMISRRHRFHGYGSLKYVYRHGRTVRGPLFSIRFVENPKRKSYRLAVVVSRKVHKSAVARNRMRRRLYALVQQLEGQLGRPNDIVLTVFSDNLADEPPASLEKQLKKLFKEAGLLTGAKTADNKL
jgi:ribonuclease P protein component